MPPREGAEGSLPCPTQGNSPWRHRRRERGQWGPGLALPVGPGGPRSAPTPGVWGAGAPRGHGRTQISPGILGGCSEKTNPDRAGEEPGGRMAPPASVGGSRGVYRAWSPPKPRKATAHNSVWTWWHRPSPHHLGRQRALPPTASTGINYDNVVLSRFVTLMNGPL